MARAQADVFLLMPFDSLFDWLHKLIVEAGQVAGAKIERADSIFEAGIVIGQVKSRIQTADAIIAVCTGHNPNVFFELGVADQWHWPIILAKEPGDLPFDIQHYRALIYGGWDEGTLQRTLVAAIQDTVKGGRKDRPGAIQKDRPPRSEPRVLGQFMMQVHAWGLEREGSLEHMPVDVLFLVQDIHSCTAKGERALAHDFPRRQGVFANAYDVIPAAEKFGVVQQHHDPEEGRWYLVLTQKGQALLKAYDRFVEEMRRGARV